MPSEPAYVEDYDEKTGEPVRRTGDAKKKVEIKKESSYRSSRKDKEKVSSDPRRALTSSSSGSSPPLKRVESRQTSKSERRMSSSSTASPKKSSRPPSVHNNATFQQLDLPIRSHAQPVPIQRVIAHSNPRPSSFHEGMYNAYGPPISNSAFYVAPQSLMPAPSYPPPNPMGGFLAYANSAPYHSNSGGVLPPGFRQDYSAPPPQIPTRTLEERLGGTRRRSIAYTPGGYDERGYESAYEVAAPLVRKSSLRKTQAQRDAERMPPPPRPQRRQSVRYADEERLDDEPFESRSRPSHQDERPRSRPRRPSISRHSVTYAYGSSDEPRVEPEITRDRNRRSGIYGAPSYSTHNTPAPINYEDQIHEAENYQTSVGGPPTRLTAESLKKASRRAPASSHSTRSSGSRDESERQRSSVTTRTTGTTRTGAGDEDITIKLKGQGKMKIAGVEIDYDKDTELSIRRGNGGGGGGSQKSSDYGASEDNRRDRRESRSDRSRMSSSMRHSRERQ